MTRKSHCIAIAILTAQVRISLSSAREIPYGAARSQLWKRPVWTVFCSPTDAPAINNPLIKNERIGLARSFSYPGFVSGRFPRVSVCCGVRALAIFKSVREASVALQNAAAMYANVLSQLHPGCEAKHAVAEITAFNSK